MPISPLLKDLATEWRSRVGRAARATMFCVFVLVVLAAAHLAWFGTEGARVLAGAVLAVFVVALLVRGVRDRRDYRDTRRTIWRVLFPADRQLAERALRAVGTVERTERDAVFGSPDLAREHFERLLRRASVDAVAAQAKRRARAWSLTGVFAIVLAAGAFLFGPMRVLEGLDILVAVDGRAPVPMKWLEAARVSARSPAYLRRTDRHLWHGQAAKLARGTILTVRGRPIRAGRELVLTGAGKEVPFVSDGKGGVVARFTLEDTTELRVAARFGDVLIEEPTALRLESVPDAAPEVLLEVRAADGEMRAAPASFELAKLDKLELQFAALDDYGLRQVDVVLRSGNSEERRTLARLDGSSMFERGGHILFSRDPFLRRMFLPVQITVEARDNDPVEGSKWGVSAPVTLMPPAVGEPEARRYSDLEGARAAIAGLVAWRLEQPETKDPTILRERRTEDARRAKEAADRLLDTLEGGPLPVPRGLATFLAGQAEVLARKVPRGGSALRESEDVLLAVDKSIRRLGVRDARSVSKRLGDVAEEAAEGARQARETEKRDDGLRRLDAAMLALDAGAEALIVLGTLGRDLGTVARSETRRIRRARKSESLLEAERAARHLAARLRRPNPSFGARGGSRGGGVEAGMGSSGEPSGEPSSADQQFDQLAGELEQLAREHASELLQVEQALGDAEKGLELDSLEDEAKRRAEAVRRAVSDLPLPGAEPGTPRASAALAREHAGAMAHSLEQLAIEDAVESGRNAMSSLDEALRKLGVAADPFNRMERDELERARQELKSELEWAEKELERLQRSASEQAAEALRGSSERERELARRAGNLASRGEISESALPRDAVDALERASGLMRDAARDLAEKRGDQGLAKQREAQRLLEQASRGQTTDGDEPRPRQRRGRVDGRDMRNDGEVPEESDGEATREFRERVLDGLGRQRGGRLGPAIQRYAEGLLR